MAKGLSLRARTRNNTGYADGLMQDRTRHYDNQHWPEDNYRAGLGDGPALKHKCKE